MEILIALLILIALVYFTHSLLVAILYVLAACVVVWAIRQTGYRRL